MILKCTGWAVCLLAFLPMLSPAQGRVRGECDPAEKLGDSPVLAPQPSGAGSCRARLASQGRTARHRGWGVRGDSQFRGAHPLPPGGHTGRNARI